MEEDFPRGGITPSQQQQQPSSSAATENEKKKNEKKRGRKRAESNDFLFGTGALAVDQQGSKKSKKQKKNAAVVDASATGTSASMSSLPLGGGAVQPPSGSSSAAYKKPAFIESISFQKLAKGMKLLGIVREVAPDYAVVSLPSMLTGFIRRDSNSGIRLDHVVNVGMVLPVVVVKATSETVVDRNASGQKGKSVLKKRIELTVSPSAVNSGLTKDMLYEGIVVRGRIRSVEDHGCLVDLNINGIGGTNCFLKYENIGGGYEILDPNDDDDEMESANDEGEKKSILNKGRVYDFTICSLPKKDSGPLSIIQLKLDTTENRSKKVIDPLTCMNSKHTIRSLCPGMLLNVDVEHHARNGLCVTFMGSVYRGAIDSNNLGGFLPDGFDLKDKKTSAPGDMWWKDVFVGKLRKITARLIAVDPVSKIMRLSLLPHVLLLKAPKQNTAKVGEIIENARVVRLDPGVGALLALPSAEEEEKEDKQSSNKGGGSVLESNSIYQTASKIRCAYVHISKAIDNDKSRTPEALFAKRFALNTTIPKLRIISSGNWMDDILSCATASSIVTSAVLTHTDLRPGVIYRGVPVIANLENGSVLVQLGIGVKGLIPAMHLFDKSMPTDKSNTSYRNKVRMEKYKVGKKIDVRCLIISPSEKKCVLTAKKGLISSDLSDPITQYSAIEPGRTATGYISRVSKQGIAITFYNNVFGRISARKLAEEMGVENPNDDYKVGDVIKAKISRCFKKEEKDTPGDDNDHRESYILDLSLNLLSDDMTKEGNPIHLIKLLEPGMILKAKSMKIVELVPSKERKDNSFLPGHAVVSVKSKHFPIEEEAKNVKGSITCKLPFEQILDSYDEEITRSPESMDALASKVLTVGKKIAQEALVLSITNRNGSISSPILSLKPTLVSTAKDISETGSSESPRTLLPKPSTALFMGAYVRGYCVRLDSSYGAFIRFLGGLTAIVPKLKGGLDIGLYDTVLCKIAVVDLTNDKSPKILLKQVHSLPKERSRKNKKKEVSTKVIADMIKPGDIIGDVKIEDLNFARAAVTLLNKKFEGANVKARIHMTMAKPVEGSYVKMPIKTEDNDVDGKDDQSKHDEKITKYHPFFTWKVGGIINDVKCVAIDVRDGKSYVELTNRDEKNHASDNSPPLFVEEPSVLTTGTAVVGVITSIAKQNTGLWVQICPGVSGFIPGLELSDDVQLLNNLEKYFKIGGRISCRVVDNKGENSQFKHDGVRLSVLGADQNMSQKEKSKKPVRGDLVLGRVNRFIKEHHAPALMIQLPGGYLGRCDITELEEPDDWDNMPLGRSDTTQQNEKPKDHDASQGAENVAESEIDDTEDRNLNLAGEYHHGLYVQCRVLASCGASKNMVEVSLRQSRLDGDLDNDEPPEQKEIVHAYVVATTKKGCFLRLSRFVEGRTILKELSDSFLPDPTSIFPPGRLVVGKVKGVKKLSNRKDKKKVSVDLDMRESVLLEDQNKVAFEDIKEGEKHRGVVTRIESYGVFVRLENSEVSGLVHLSECSDDYVKNLATMYNPGDLVKVLVLRVEKDEKRIGLSMKASHFEDDEESDLESMSDSEDDDVVMKDVNDAGLDSDDENFVSKLANKLDDKKVDSSVKKSSDDSDSSDDESSSQSSDDDDDDDESLDGKAQAMDTDVGFDWGTNGRTEEQKEDSESSEESDSEDEDENAVKKGHKSRKKTLVKRQEEKVISKMEQRIADGTADENPETTADFERLVASDPNSSENWMKYMAYHLSLADIESARSIANRAFDRIEFREEGEKLNVWTALITLESKYGTPTTLNATIDRASQHNNPKQVYLRVCEMMERDVEQSHGDATMVQRADDMFAKMCKKFRSKKTVWIANFKYLLKNGRHEEAHDLWKRSVLSLPSHKHIESMSKFAQLEYEYGSAERARTIFDGLVDKHPKRMDLIFVYVDKEIKHGEVSTARQIFEKIVNPIQSGQKKVKYNDKQMKSLFKKWYRMEDDHGDEESRMHVKVAAKEYVEKSTK